MKKITRFLLSAIILLAIYIPLYSTTANPSAYKLTNFKMDQLKQDEIKVIITFKKKTSIRKISSLKNEKVNSLKDSSVVTASLSKNQIETLAKNDQVASIEKDQKVQISVVSSIDMKSVQAMAQSRDWGIDKVKAPSAWSSCLTGKGVKVAVIDTGVGPHEDVIVSGGISFVPYTTSYADDNGHGTHVAGMISAENNSLGVVGVAPDTSIYAVKVLDNTGSGYVSDIIKGLDWAITNKMDIVNMSLGFYYDSPALEAAINNAVGKGILVVAAAGNSGNYTGFPFTVSYPAEYENVIAVAAMDRYYLRADFSSTGPEVDVAAPGVDVYSTYLNNSYTTLSGTSMASPYIVGELSLLKQKYPTDTVQAIRNRLTNLAFDLGNSGVDAFYGYGLPIYGNDGSVTLPLKTKLTVTKSSEIIKPKDIISFTIKVTDQSNKPVSNASIYFNSQAPSTGMMSIVTSTTNRQGLATITLQSYTGYQTSEIGNYLVLIKAYKEGVVGSFGSKSFTVTQ
ncbi:S8 family serine peptidase [Gottfriedia sp. OAE603]|uniref:S8 family serine peptidase n=1 Tax=Gottfriedia sp. OAE603 TaxID=2663872 RepID=UPI001789200E